MKNELIKCACGCGQTLPRYSADGRWRERRFILGHNVVSSSVVIKCANCEKPITRAPYYIKRNKNCFCGILCRIAFRRKQVTVECRECHRLFEVRAYRVKEGASLYCSTVCRFASHHAALRCDYCGQPVRKFKSSIKKHSFCSVRCGAAWRSENLRGENNSLWLGGHNKIDRGASWKSSRLQTLERDNYACVICGSGKQLTVHHIQRVRLFEKPDIGNVQKTSLHFAANVTRR